MEEGNQSPEKVSRKRPLEDDGDEDKDDDKEEEEEDDDDEFIGPQPVVGGNPEAASDNNSTIETQAEGDRKVKRKKGIVKSLKLFELDEFFRRCKHELFELSIVWLFSIGIRTAVSVQPARC